MSDGNNESPKPDASSEVPLPNAEDVQLQDVQLTSNTPVSADVPADQAVPAAQPAQSESTAPVPVPAAQLESSVPASNVHAPVSHTSEAVENKAPEPSKHILPNPALSAAAVNDDFLREKHIGQVIDCIRDVVDGKKLTPGMLVRVVANCMMITQKMKLPGGIKKKVVVSGLERYIRTCPDIDEDEVQILMTAVDVYVDDAINVIAAVQKGDIAVKSCCIIV
jgi:hypothetical protein